MNLEDQIFTLRSAIIKAKKEMKRDQDEEPEEKIDSAVEKNSKTIEFKESKIQRLKKAL